ncbi:unnamed protein product [Knipowitschia caucasica]|uniref:valine--tRNA ligase n=1 Tax=Knipowitschia caucasica TaxID=637954 RepID=A0AAV2K8M6_KNICA
MLGWPHQTKDLEQFYPNSILETGSDLIFFWVARMVMLGTELTGQLPFKQVLLHSLVRDKHGRKMSKSLGNVIDPLDVIHGTTLESLQQKVRARNLDPREQLVAMEAQEKDFPKGIPPCGADALRLALCSHKTQGEDINLSLSQILSSRHFCNKLWQTLRFVLGVLEAGAAVETLEKLGPLGSMERWVLSRLYSTVVQCERGFEAYELHSVTTALTTFWVSNLCDVYMEYMKPLLSPQSGGTLGAEGTAACSVLVHCVSTCLTLLSPFMPFITEELWQRLQPHRPPQACSQACSGAPQDTLCLQPYPRSQQLAPWHFPDEERDFLWVQEVVRVTRSLRAQSGLTKEKPAMWVECSSSQAQILHNYSSALQTLSRVSCVQLLGDPAQAGDQAPSAPPKGCVVGVVDHTCTLHLHVKSGVNVDKQISALSLRRARLMPKLEQLLIRGQSQDFQTKVPPHVRDSLARKVSALEQELKNTEEQLQQLREIKEELTEQ